MAGHEKNVNVGVFKALFGQFTWHTDLSSAGEQRPAKVVRHSVELYIGHMGCLGRSDELVPGFHLQDLLPQDREISTYTSNARSDTASRALDRSSWKSRGK
jgi:hypothetical protein